MFHVKRASLLIADRLEAQVRPGIADIKLLQGLNRGVHVFGLVLWPAWRRDDHPDDEVSRFLALTLNSLAADP